jgi:hypothetical protein
MIFDTDIFIWAQRGNEKVVRLFEKEEEKYLSVQTYMELLQNAKNKTQHKYTKDFLTTLGFIVLPLTENIGHRASIYILRNTHCHPALGLVTLSLLQQQLKTI